MQLRKVRDAKAKSRVSIGKKFNHRRQLAWDMHRQYVVKEPFCNPFNLRKTQATWGINNAFGQSAIDGYWKAIFTRDGQFAAILWDSSSSIFLDSHHPSNQDLYQNWLYHCQPIHTSNLQGKPQDHLVSFTIESLWSNHMHMDFLWRHTTKLGFTKMNKLNYELREKLQPL